jgi:hypothetical protein
MLVKKTMQVASAASSVVYWLSSSILAPGTQNGRPRCDDTSQEAFVFPQQQIRGTTSRPDEYVSTSEVMLLLLL